MAEARSEDPSTTTDKEIIIPSDVEPKPSTTAEKDKAKTSAMTGNSNEPTSDSEWLQRYSKGNDKLDYAWDYYKH